MKIEDASPKEISEYLQYIVDTADRVSERGVVKGNHEVWKKAYDTIFSSTVSDVIYERFPDFHPYIPDTTYIEDVTAFVRDFKEFAENEEIKNKYFMSFEDFSNNSLENE